MAGNVGVAGVACESALQLLKRPCGARVVCIISHQSEWSNSTVGLHPIYGQEKGRAAETSPNTAAAQAFCRTSVARSISTMI